MNRESALQLLISLLAGIEIFPGFIDELVDIIALSGREMSFIKRLAARLAVLAELGVLATAHKEIEPIEQGIFSLHVTDRDYNIRILYGFLPNGAPVLLLPFYERGGKKKTDYTPYVMPAAERLREAKEEFLNERK